MSKKIIQRLLVFFIGVPFILSLAVISFRNHLAMHIAIIISSGIAAKEMYDILKEKILVQNFSIFLISILFIPIVSALVAVCQRSSVWISLSLIVSLTVSFVFEVFSEKNKEDFNGLVQRFCSSAFAIVYIGFFFSYLSRLTIMEYSNVFIALFFIIVFATDSFAWLFGMLFGEGNRGFIRVSPNKSVAGFLGGILGALFLSMGVYFFFPHVFNNNLFITIITSVSVSFAAIFGDLVESGIKRSSSHKDSGNVIPGRGGLLDSIDSMLFAAPVYYLVLSFFLV